MDKSGFLTVDYDDSLQSSYVALILYYGDKKEMRFDTGNPLIDWYDFCKIVFDGEESEKYNMSGVGYSSSVDHWFMDGNEYIEKYLKLNDNDEYDFILTEELNNLSLSELNSLKRCVIQKDMKSFQELKKYYSEHKNKYI